METNQPSPTSKSGLEILNKIEELCDEYLVKKAPFTLPPNAKDIIVKLMPWLVIFSIIMGIPSVLLLFGIHTVAFGLGTYYYSLGMMGYVHIILITIGLVFEIMALPGLFNQALGSWRFLFYAALLSLLGNILSVNVMSIILNIVIGLFFLFQVKERYH